MHFWCDFNKLFETSGETVACFIPSFTSEANRREVIEWAVWLTTFLGDCIHFPLFYMDCIQKMDVAMVMSNESLLFRSYLYLNYAIIFTCAAKH